MVENHEREIHERKIHIGVIFGGRSGEHEVSVRSAQSVVAALDPARYAITQVWISHTGAWWTGGDVLGALRSGRMDGLYEVALLPDPTRPGLFRLAAAGAPHQPQAAFDVVFPVLHGTYGEDGCLQGLLELAGAAYVGAGVLGSAVGMDKALFKDVMRANGIPVVDALTATRQDVENGMEALISRAERLASYPLFVKPANLGSSVGITKCQSRSDLLEGLLDAARFDRRLVIERGVNGREIEVAVLGNENPQASTVGEIRPSREFYSYEAKYEDGTSDLLIPAPLSPELTARVQQIAVRAYQAIDCAGLARVDFLLDRDTGELFLNEINTIPGFTEISMYAKLWEHSGLSYAGLVDRLVTLAFERHAERQRTERRYRRDD